MAFDPQPWGQPGGDSGNSVIFSVTNGHQTYLRRGFEVAAISRRLRLAHWSGVT